MKLTSPMSRLSYSVVAASLAAGLVGIGTINAQDWHRQMMARGNDRFSGYRNQRQLRKSARRVRSGLNTRRLA